MASSKDDCARYLVNFYALNHSGIDHATLSFFFQNPQWAGEVISSRDKPTVNEEFKELEKDIELREKGVQRLLVASSTYQHYLSKKKTNEALPDEEKTLPMDALGVVMIVHGEEFPKESEFGSALVQLGRAHCKIASMQEEYAVAVKDTFLASMDRFKEDIKEYELIKKKVENRRVIAETATAKFEKLQNGKKEKEKREAEDEMERAKQRYEETTEDLRAHMHAVQENEHTQLNDLTAFLELETSFVQSYLDILKDLKTDWPDRSENKKRTVNGTNGRSSASMMLHSAPGTPRPASKASTRARASSTATPAVDSDEDDSDAMTTPGKHGKHQRGGSTNSRPPSRPTSRMSRISRKRADSSSPPAGGEKDKEKDKEKEKDKDKSDKAERQRRKSVTGWASSAVDSVTGSGHKSRKSKDKDAFTTLDDDQPISSSQPSDFGTPNGSVKKKSSIRGLTRRSSKTKSKENISGGPISGNLSVPRILKPPSLQDKKIVRAMYDFAGSSDELSFRAGNEIVVVNEVLDDWWMGELNGQRGLFPTSYTQVIDPRALGGRSNKFDFDDGSEFDGGQDDTDADLTTDAEEEQQIIRATPMAANKSPLFFGGFEDKSVFSDSQAEEEEDGPAPPPLPRRPRNIDDFDSTWLAPAPTAPSQSQSSSKRAILKSLDPAQQPLISRTQSESPTTPQMGSSGPRKIPPPPPPRRALSAQPPSGPPAIPERKAPSMMSSLSSSSLSVSSHGHGDQGQEYDKSPFESAVDLEVGAVPCQHFRQNPFKPKGMCSNCLEFHA
ncbi:hypothetical protein D9619_009134 [Psilocybe cf. subviscida]|uniref:SH3 domain-containing protein n=1 Tax=Psilocybe cf. subviscida TaxID=2480587 RepID=A0A8H5FAI7_9AGAR|nr:hypothetical protein D9619_009134 [Psilocybe cf. subviscida]